MADRKAALSVLAALHPEEPGRDRRLARQLVGFVRIRNPGARAASFDWPRHRDPGDGDHIAGTGLARLFTIMELIDACAGFLRRGEVHAYVTSAGLHCWSG